MLIRHKNNIAQVYDQKTKPILMIIIWLINCVIYHHNVQL